MDVNLLSKFMVEMLELQYWESHKFFHVQTAHTQKKQLICDVFTPKNAKQRIQLEWNTCSKLFDK